MKVTTNKIINTLKVKPFIDWFSTYFDYRIYCEY